MIFFFKNEDEIISIPIWFSNITVYNIPQLTYGYWIHVGSVCVLSFLQWDFIWITKYL